MSDNTPTPQTNTPSDQDTNDAIEAMLRNALGIPKPQKTTDVPAQTPAKDSK